MQVIKRNGQIVEFDRVKIENAVLKAFASVKETINAIQENSIEETVYSMTTYTYSLEDRASNPNNPESFINKPTFSNRIEKSKFQFTFLVKKLLSSPLNCKFKIYNLN